MYMVSGTNFDQHSWTTQQGKCLYNKWQPSFSLWSIL